MISEIVHVLILLGIEKKNHIAPEVIRNARYQCQQVSTTNKYLLSIGLLPTQMRR
jgi:exopolysaccharide biosynthesis protein